MEIRISLPEIYQLLCHNSIICILSTYLFVDKTIQFHKTVLLCYLIFFFYIYIIIFITHIDIHFMNNFSNFALVFV